MQHCLGTYKSGFVRALAAKLLGDMPAKVSQLGLALDNSQGLVRAIEKQVEMATDHGEVKLFVFSKTLMEWLDMNVVFSRANKILATSEVSETRATLRLSLKSDGTSVGARVMDAKVDLARQKQMLEAAEALLGPNISDDDEEDEENAKQQTPPNVQSAMNEAASAMATVEKGEGEQILSPLPPSPVVQIAMNEAASAMTTVGNGDLTSGSFIEGVMSATDVSAEKQPANEGAFSFFEECLGMSAVSGEEESAKKAYEASQGVASEAAVETATDQAAATRGEITQSALFEGIVDKVFSEASSGQAATVEEDLQVSKNSDDAEIIESVPGEDSAHPIKVEEEESDSEGPKSDDESDSHDSTDDNDTTCGNGGGEQLSDSSSTSTQHSHRKRPRLAVVSSRVRRGKGVKKVQGRTVGHKRESSPSPTRIEYKKAVKDLERVLATDEVRENHLKSKEKLKKDFKSKEELLEKVNAWDEGSSKRMIMERKNVIAILVGLVRICSLQTKVLDAITADEAYLKRALENLATPFERCTGCPVHCLQGLNAAVKKPPGRGPSKK